MRWHYHDGTNQVGPLEDAQLIELMKSGRIRGNTQVWKEGTPSWVRAASTEFAQNLLPEPPPMNPQPPPLTSQNLPPSPMTELSAKDRKNVEYGILGGAAMMVMPTTSQGFNAAMSGNPIGLLWFFLDVAAIGVALYGYNEFKKGDFSTARSVLLGAAIAVCSLCAGALVLGGPIFMNVITGVGAVYGFGYAVSKLGATSRVASAARIP